MERWVGAARPVVVGNQLGGDPALPMRAPLAAEGESGRQPWEFGRFLRTVTFFNPLDKMLKDLVLLPTRLLFKSNVEEEVRGVLQHVIGIGAWLKG